MKISLGLGPRQPLNRQTAWGCLTTNLAIPGMGSLVAGRRVGYPQLAIAIVAMFLTVVFSARFVSWLLANWSRVYNSDADPVTALAEMWRALRWALFSIGAFCFSWVWALLTSLQIVNSAKHEAGNV